MYYVIDKKNYNTEDLHLKAREVLKKHRFCIIKNFNSPKIQKEILKIITKRFKPDADIRISGPLKVKMKDYQRLDIGDAYKNTRFLRIITFSEFQKNNKKFFSLINPVLQLRNKVSNIEKVNLNYPKAESISKEKKTKKSLFCDFIRMVQYPSGGGFLDHHHDYDDNYCKGVMNALLPITVKKSKNFKRQLSSYGEGGLYLIINKKKIIIDDIINTGDVLLFNPKIYHGVKSVDYKKNLDLKKLNGRLTIAFSIANFLQ